MTVHQVQEGEARARVVEAALALVAEKGPDRLRVRDVAERAGMSSGHVMYYVKSRDRIIVELLLLSEDELAERRDRAVARHRDPVRAATAVLSLYLPDGPGDVRWALWAQVLARPPADADTRKRLREAVAGWTGALAQVIARAAPELLEPQAVAYRLTRLCDGLAMELLLSEPDRSRRWALAEATRALHHELASG